MGKIKSLKDRLAEKRKELAKKGAGNFDTFILNKEGTHRLRPVPVGSEEDWSMEIVTFYLSKEDGSIISPATFGEECPFMEAYEELKKSKDKADKALAEKIKPKRKMAILHYRYRDEKGKDPDVDAGVKPLVIGPRLCGDLIDLFMDDEGGDFTDPKKGFDIKYKRTGTGQFDTEYSLIKCNPTPLCKKFRGPYNLEEEIRKLIKPYEELKEKLDDFLKLDPEEENSSKKKKKSKKIKKHKRDI